MRLFIVGQKWLGREVLGRCLAAGHEVAGVAGPSASGSLAEAARAAGVPVTVAARRLEAEAVPEGVDLILAAHAHCYITRAARARARLGALGYHPSLLPRHRGRDAIRWAVHMREPVTGGTVYWMDDGADTGPIALQDWCHILPGDDPATLWRRELGPMGLRLLIQAVELAARDELPRVEQDHAAASWEPAFTGGSLSGV